MSYAVAESILEASVENLDEAIIPGVEDMLTDCRQHVGQATLDNIKRALDLLEEIKQDIMEQYQQVMWQEGS